MKALLAEWREAAEKETERIEYLPEVDLKAETAGVKSSDSGGSIKMFPWKKDSPEQESPESVSETGLSSQKETREKGGGMIPSGQINENDADNLRRLGYL